MPYIPIGQATSAVCDLLKYAIAGSLRTKRLITILVVVAVLILAVAWLFLGGAQLLDAKLGGQPQGVPVPAASHRVAAQPERPASPRPERQLATVHADLHHPQVVPLPVRALTRRGPGPTPDRGELASSPAG